MAVPSSMNFPLIEGYEIQADGKKAIYLSF